MIESEKTTYRYTKKAGEATAQSRVECKLSGSEISEVLAVRAEAYPASCVCGEKTADYGGKVIFFIVYIDGEGRVCRAERGVEFSHRAECEEADEDSFCALRLTTDDVSYRREGSNLAFSAVVSATAEIYRDDEFSYLSGGKNLVVQKREKTFVRATLSVADGEENDVFETEYFSDVLLHGETAYVKSATVRYGAVKIEGEIALNVCVLKGDGSLASYERLIPVSFETPAPYFCDEKWQSPAEEVDGRDTAENGENKAESTGDILQSARARIVLKPVSLTVETSEERNKCTIRAEFPYAVQIVQYTAESLQACEDAFSPKAEVTLTRGYRACRRLKCTKTYVKKAEGVAAVDSPIDYTAAFLAAALPRAEATIKDSGKGEIEIEGAATARLLLSDKDGLRAANVTLPFLFAESEGEGRNADGRIDAEAEAIACGVSLRQKKEGEAIAEVTLKITVYFYETARAEYLVDAEEGEAYDEEKCALSVFLPRGGDGLWETAKNLRKSPEEVLRSNPELVFPLKDRERILVYNRKE